jgi:Holliday junction resolvase RusA-like endonuclease
MSDPKGLIKAERALQETAKSLVFVEANLREAQEALRDESAAGDPSETLNACGRFAENPKRLLITIEGPIPTLNLELKRYLPQDRFIWATMRDWWRGQIAAGIAYFDGAAHFTSPVVFLRVGARCDLDNLGLKALMDALVFNHVIEDDGKGVRFLGLEHMDTSERKLELCVAEPGDEFDGAMKVFRQMAEFPDNPKAEHPSSGKAKDFFTGDLC